MGDIAGSDQLILILILALPAIIIFSFIIAVIGGSGSKSTRPNGTPSTALIAAAFIFIIVATVFITWVSGKLWPGIIIVLWGILMSIIFGKKRKSG